MKPRAYNSMPSFKLIEAHSKNTLKNKAVQLVFSSSRKRGFLWYSTSYCVVIY